MRGFVIKHKANRTVGLFLIAAVFVFAGAWGVVKQRLAVADDPTYWTIIIPQGNSGSGAICVKYSNDGKTNGAQKCENDDTLITVNNPSNGEIYVNNDTITQKPAQILWCDSGGSSGCKNMGLVCDDATFTCKVNNEQPQIQVYSVTYDKNSNDATGSVPVDQTYPSGSDVTVGGDDYMARAGYTFVGWNTAANGSGVSYNAGDVFKILANTTLYAQWTETETPPAITPAEPPVEPPVSPPVAPPTTPPTVVPTNPANPTTPTTTRPVTTGSTTAAAANNANAAVPTTEPTATDTYNYSTSTNNQQPQNSKGEVLGAQDSSYWALMNLILAAITALMSIIVLIAWLGKDEKDNNRHSLLRVLTLVPAIGAVIAFFLTEDWTLPMHLVDVWTWLMAAIFVVQIILIVMATRHSERRKENERQKAFIEN